MSSRTRGRPIGSAPAPGGGPAGRSSVLVGIGGGSGSGKTTVVQELVRSLGTATVSVIQHDAYYRDLSHAPFDERARTNFDHPDSLETELLARHLSELLGGRAVEVPTYDFAKHTRRAERRRVTPTPVIVIDGILVLADPALRALLDLSVFVHAAERDRLARRIARDTALRGRSPESVVEQFHATVRPMHDLFVEPSRAHADVTIPEGGHNLEAIRGLVRRVELLVSSRAAGPGWRSPRA